MKGVFGRMVRHEWRSLTADRTVWLVSIIFGLLILYAVGNGVGWVRSQGTVLDSVETDSHRRLTQLAGALDSIPADAPPPAAFGRDPRSPASVGNIDGAQFATLRPQALAPLAVGQTDLLPQYLRVTMRSKLTLAAAQELENPSNLLEGRFDLAFVVVYLFPLFILALGFNLLAAERESGTLGMIAAQPVSLASHLGAKVVVRGGFILGLAMLVTLLGLLLTGALAGMAPAKLGLWFLVLAAYGAFWFAVSVVVNAVPRSSAANATILAGVWLLLVVVVPAVAGTLVNTLHPMPSRVELIGAMRTASNDASARGAQLLAQVYGDHPDLAPTGTVTTADFMSRTYAVQEEVDRQLAPLADRFDEQLGRQHALAARYQLASPALVASFALADLAGTGPARYRHWRDQVASYHETWQEFFIPRAFRREWLDASIYPAIPRFAYTEESHSAVLGRVGVALLVLLLPTVLLALYAAPRLRRYQVAG
ncbi:MAG: DUF3526 domain-containing protein [Gemmatimonadales bacterium]|nr:DUF3526 domain-containing protein [Gemmatimonadales bacterium]